MDLFVIRRGDERPRILRPMWVAMRRQYLAMFVESGKCNEGIRVRFENLQKMANAVIEMDVAVCVFASCDEADSLAESS